MPLDLLGLAGGREVDSLFEIRAFQGVRFVEDRQGLETTGGDHAFEREFALQLTAIGHVEPVGTHGPGPETKNRGQQVPIPRGHSHFSS